MLRAILFDLDDTLLQTQTMAFMERYFVALGQYLGDVAEPHQMRAWIMQATQRLLDREHPRETNVEAFGAEFAQLSGLPMTHLWPRFWRFYSEVFPTLGGEVAPMPFAREAVLEAQDAGLKTVIATNPLFPLVAIKARVAWAGLSDIEFDLITALDDMHSAKPQQAYFHEVAARIGVPEAECLMVGNDPAHDIVPAKAAGMWAFLITGDAGNGRGADAAGDMEAFLTQLRERRLPAMDAD